MDEQPNNPYNAGKGLRAAMQEHAAAPFAGVPTTPGDQLDIRPGADGHAYLDMGVIAGNPLLAKCCHGPVLTEQDLPMDRDGKERRTQTGIWACRRDIFPMLNEQQKAAAMKRYKESRYYREGRDPRVWGGDTIINLDTGVQVRLHALLELVKTSAPGSAEGGGDGDETEQSIDDALAKEGVQS